MSRKKTRLELTWIGKEERPKLEPRILLEDPGKSYHASVRRPGDIFDNMLIHGDNLLALRALESDYSSRIKCVCIDPPYNTGAAFAQYDDGVEHSLWLSLMRARLEILHRLLSADGSIWIVIDDNEAHYLKVMLDEVFGRSNFIGCIVWQHSVQGKNDAKGISLHHNYVLAYRKSDAFERKLLPRTAKHNTNYSNPDDDPRGPWRSGDVRSPHYRENLCFIVTTPGGKTIDPPAKGWRWGRETFAKKVESGEISFVNDETRVLRKIYLSEQKGRVPESIWLGEEVGTTRQAAAEVASVTPDGQEPFATPKPERLIQRILQIATDEGDWVLDSFAGSGTTGAVAHKMKRHWVMVELGEHCETHTKPRMEMVVDGTDQAGISEETGWEGGGGFRYYHLAPSLLQKDEYGNWIINKDYNAAMLAEALCKIEGFKYDPSPEVYWQQGRSTETDYIFVTTQTMTADMLQKLSDEVGPDRSLLVMCKAFRSKREWPNLTVKKIPKAVLAKCEWGQDDYSLEIKELPVVEDELEATDGGPQVEPKANGAAKKRRRKAAAIAGGNLFAGETDDSDQEVE